MRVEYINLEDIVLLHEPPLLAPSFQPFSYCSECERHVRWSRHQPTLSCKAFLTCCFLIIVDSSCSILSIQNIIKIVLKVSINYLEQLLVSSALFTPGPFVIGSIVVSVCVEYF